MGTYRLERSQEIAAPASTIWNELLNANAWPAWKPFIRRIRFAGSRLGPESQFTMTIAVKGPAVPVAVRVCAFDAPRRIAWTGGLPGAVISVHGFDLDELGSRTRVTSWEEFTGALVGLMKLFVTPADLAGLHDRWLDAIQKRMAAKGTAA